MSGDKQTEIAEDNERFARDMEIIRRSKPEDYDGHTEFHRMTPNQRLEWLDYAVELIEASKAGKFRVSEPPADDPL